MGRTNTITSYIEKIKETVNEIANLNIKEKYIIEAYIEDGKNYIAITDNNNNKIFNKEISKEEYEKIKRDMDKYSISNFYIDKIKEILEPLKENKIIEDYQVNLYYYSKNLTSTVKKESVDIYINIFLNKDTYEELTKKVKDDNDYVNYIEDLNENKNIIMITKNIIIGIEVDDDKAIYTTKEWAEEIIKQYSK